MTARKNQKDTAEPVSDNNVDKVREILFGSQLRDFERRLGELSESAKSDARQAREETDKQLARLEERLNTEWKRAEERLRKEQDERVAALKDLGTRLGQLEERLQGAVRDQEDQLSQTAKDLRDGLSAQAKDLSEQLRQAREDQRQALERESTRLNDEKTGREELAQLFTETALRLQRQFELPE